MDVYVRAGDDDPQFIDQWDDGFGWFAHPDEEGARAGHAVRGDDGVWLVDPLDAPGLDDRITDLGEVVGVVVLSSYHARDAGVLAERHGVAVHLPAWMDRVSDRVDAPVERFTGSFGDPPFRVRRFEPLSMWREAVAFRESDGTLVVPDLLGTGPGYAVGDERVGVVLSHRLWPPRRLAGLDPARILFGHGEGVFDGASAALTDALDGARRRFPRALARHFRTNVRLMAAATRE
ncbi:hypothetical protein [Halobaculum marinum]|uniref:Metallo-beta-lactamase superfamily protein n=1 Tax=Halobaculum marinum TaxID=3031996 RepID=A0ABD5WZB0_9EURY|nr:hypothetical protein [Halobaculum sp. DT55]